MGIKSKISIRRGHHMNQACQIVSHGWVGGATEANGCRAIAIAVTGADRQEVGTCLSGCGIGNQISISARKTATAYRGQCGGLI